MPLEIKREKLNLSFNLALKKDIKHTVKSLMNAWGELRSCFEWANNCYSAVYCHLKVLFI